MAVPTHILAVGVRIRQAGRGDRVIHICITPLVRLMTRNLLRPQAAIAENTLPTTGDELEAHNWTFLLINRDLQAPSPPQLPLKTNGGTIASPHLLRPITALLLLPLLVLASQVPLQPRDMDHVMHAATLSMLLHEKPKTKDTITAETRAPSPLLPDHMEEDERRTIISADTIKRVGEVARRNMNKAGAIPTKVRAMEMVLSIEEIQQRLRLFPLATELE